MNKNNSSRRIQILRDSVARRIAAGEVIDRPQAVVRELLDNSIDAGSTEINLFIRGGGIDEIRVVDNGCGMDEEDLKKCFLPHSTSKIVDFEDIYNTKTMGFRGEALSSIAACSRLSIISSADSGQPAHKLEIRDGKLHDLSEYRGSRGTVISVRDLFYSMPGRKNFLKSASTESSQCRSMFIEKAVAQPQITFRFFADDNLRLFLPASDLHERIKAAYGSLFQGGFLHYYETDSDEIGLSAVLGTPSLYRRDRKYIHVFINKRRVSDYSLVQAVDYAYSSYLPGGCHPVCFLFLDIPSEHVDFNIHPAKREVKFRNLPSVHHSVTDAVGKYLSGRNSFRARVSEHPPAAQRDLSFTGNKQANPFTVSEASMNPDYKKPGGATSPIYPKAALSSGNKTISESIFRNRTLESIASEVEIPSAEKPVTENSLPLIYLGQVFNLFLLFEQGENLIIIDQHAAHERIIFNSLSDKPPEIQELLVPIDFKLERDEENNLEKNISDYETLGFELQKVSSGEWLINGMPSVCSGMEDEIIAFFKNRISGIEELKKELFAMISCRTAIKDGDNIDSVSALGIATKVLEMENPRCPHGRPVLQLLPRDQLFRMFGRTF